MSQFSAYKKEAQKKSASKKRDTSIAKLELNDLKKNLDIFKEESPEPVQVKKEDQNEAEISKKVQTVSGHSLDIVQTQSGPMRLTEKQYKVYRFFLDNGPKGTFNRTIISAKTNVTRASVKAAIVKFQKHKMIEIGPLCPISKVQTYTLNLAVKVSGHSPDIVQTMSRPIELSEFWTKAGLTPQKCNEWLGEIPGLTPERLQIQLEYGEHTDLVLNATKGPIKYMYGCLKGNPLVKPLGYRTTEDKYVDIMEQRLKEVAQQQEAIETLEKARQKERELADQESFLIFLADHDAVTAALDEIKDEHMTGTLKTSVNTFVKTQSIDSRLENRLKVYFQKS
jgi:hypothetical protein